jgi:hypothetical protein
MPPEAINEFCARRWEMRSKKIRVETNSEMRKHYPRSPETMPIASPSPSNSRADSAPSLEPNSKWRVSACARPALGARRILFCIGSGSADFVIDPLKQLGERQLHVCGDPINFAQAFRAHLF